jgi:hypothetical protein
LAVPFFGSGAPSNLKLFLRFLALHASRAHSAGMRKESFVVASLVTGVLVLALSATASSAAADDAGAPSLPACIQVTTLARYIPYGYNHIVTLKSGCSKAATCTVSTDVNPQPTSAEVASGTSVDVLTFTASPSQVFTAYVSCRLH